MGAISELYHGRLGPSHSIKPDNIRYHQLLDKCSELREKLEPQLSEDGLAVFAELYERMDLRYSQNCMICRRRWHPWRWK